MDRDQEERLKPPFSSKEGGGDGLHLCGSRTWSQRKCLFNVNLFSFPGDKNEGYWKDSCLVEEVITFFSFKSQRNNAFIFPEMTQFVLWYAPLNVSVQVSSPCIGFPQEKCPVAPRINLSTTLAISMCRNNSRVLPLPWGLQSKGYLARCLIISNSVKIYLQLSPIFSNCIRWGSPCLRGGKCMQMLAVGRKKSSQVCN